MRHVVRPGESPMSIARMYTGDRQRFHELVGANPHKPRHGVTFQGLAAGEALTLPKGWVSSELTPANVLHAQGSPVKLGGQRPVPIPPGVIKTVPGQFHVGVLADKIAGLRPLTNGFSVEIRQGGVTLHVNAWGWAKRPNDGSATYSVSTPQHIGSVSKLFTAVAMNRLLREHVVSVNRPILPFLPSYWDTGPGVENITFRHLLTHTSGLIDSDPSTQFRTDYPYMKAQIAAGPQGTLGSYAYRNMNFALCRILLSVIQGDIDPKWYGDPGESVDDIDSVWDTVTIRSFASYVQDNVFAPAGVQAPTLTRRDGSALAYRWPPVDGGWDSGDLSIMAGGGGWHMTVSEVLDVVGMLRRTDTIIPSAEFTAAILGQLEGIDTVMRLPWGGVYTKGGLWCQSATGGNTAADLSTEQAAVYIMPLDVELAIQVNSPVGDDNEDLQTYVSEAIASAYTS